MTTEAILSMMLLITFTLMMIAFAAAYHYWKVARWYAIRHGDKEEIVEKKRLKRKDLELVEVSVMIDYFFSKLVIEFKLSFMHWQKELRRVSSMLKSSYLKGKILLQSFNYKDETVI